MQDHTVGNGPLLEANIGDDGILYLLVAGRIPNDQLYTFIAWTEKVKYLIKEEYDRTNGTVLVLTDASGVRSFERKPIKPFRELLDYDKKYPIRSAVYGAAGLTRMLLEAVISLTGRTNIRLFPDKKGALAWLTTPGSIDVIAQTGDGFRNEETPFLKGEGK